MMKKQQPTKLNSSSNNLINNTKQSLNNNTSTTSTNNKQNNKNNNSNKIDYEQQAQQSIMDNEIGRRYEVLFKKTNWQLNEDDGKSSCAKFLIKNFLYTKIINQYELDCIEHTLEIESCKIADLSSSAVPATTDSTTNNNNINKKVKKAKNINIKLNNTNHYVLTSLFENKNINLNSLNGFPLLIDETFDLNSNTDKNNGVAMFRIFCKERSPVGGIPIFEHLELNVSPLAIMMTNRFYTLMMRFFFEQSATGGPGPGTAIVPGQIIGNNQTVSQTINNNNINNNTSGILTTTNEPSTNINEMNNTNTSEHKSKLKSKIIYRRKASTEDHLEIKPKPKLGNFKSKNDFFLKLNQ
jgi:hypothetical protein